MKAWFLARPPNERIAIVVLAVVPLCLLFYLFAWQPLAEEHAQLRQRIAAQRDTIVWMRGAAREIRALQQRQVAPAGGDESLLALIDRTATRQQLKPLIQRLRPSGEDQVEIWIDKAPFDDLVGWLGTLEQQQRIAVASLSIDSTPQHGRVDARLQLERGGR